jgi:hypothetical protein
MGMVITSPCQKHNHLAAQSVQWRQSISENLAQNQEGDLGLHRAALAILLLQPISTVHCCKHREVCKAWSMQGGRSSNDACDVAAGPHRS